MRRIGEGTALFDEDATHEEIPAGTTLRGREEIGGGMEEVLIGFPDLDTRIINSVVEGDKVVIEVSWKGTQKGEFRGTRPTGKSFTLKAVFVFELKRGKIKKVREYYDTGMLAKQLG
jgi:steroid delta-isomerase-like uncharacterized protein